MEYRILSEEIFPEEIKKIEQDLKLREITGYFAAYDGCKIYYEYYLAERARGAVVMVHGFTEFCKKYTELCHYFLQQGYHVFLFDLRGHGLSQRQVEDMTLIHVDSYGDYVKDLETFVREVVRPASKELPLCLFGHSMGGAISTLYLMEHPEEFSKAVLSSPMVVPVMPVPVWFLKPYTKRLGKKEGWKARFRHASDFDPEPSFEASSDTSLSRFHRHIAQRLSNERYQSSSSTNGWMYQTLLIKKKLLNREKLGRIRTKVLLIQAGKDGVVCLRPQEKLAKRLSDCHLECFSEAKHTIFNAGEEILTPYVALVSEFLEG